VPGVRRRPHVHQGEALRRPVPVLRWSLQTRGPALPEQGNQGLRLRSGLRVGSVWRVDRVWCARGGEGLIMVEPKEPSPTDRWAGGGSQCRRNPFGGFS
jgi:hypothetical protein